MFGLTGFRAGDSRFNRRFTRVDGFGGGLNVSRRGILLFGFTGLRAGDSRFNCRFPRVGSLGGGLFRLLILLRQLAGAGLGFTGFARGDGFTVIRLRSGLDNDRLGGIALFFANPGQRGVNRGVICCARLNRGLFVAFQTRGFIPLQASLAGLKAGFGLRRALFFLTKSRNLSLFLTEILYQRNITRADPGAGATLDAVGQVMGGGFIVLLTFAEPVQLLRQQIGRTGVRAGTTANTAFFFLGFAHFAYRRRQQAVGDFNHRHVKPRQGESHQRAAHNDHLFGARAEAGIFQQMANRCSQPRPHVARTSHRFSRERHHPLGQRLTVDYRAFNRIGGPDVLHQDANVRRAPAVGDLLAGQDLRQLLRAAGRVLGGNHPQFDTVRIGKDRPHHRDSLRFIILNTDQHLTRL